MANSEEWAIPPVKANATILVKDVEAMVCKQCGAWYVDPGTLEQVRKLIEQETKSRHEVSVASIKKRLSCRSFWKNDLCLRAEK